MSSYCTNCSPCNSCQGECVNCQKCNNGCQISCDTAQTWCNLGKETISLACEQGDFAFSYRPVANLGIIGPGYFDQNVWDEIAAWISKRATLPTETPETKEKGAGAPGGTTNEVGGTVVLASDYNAVVPFSADEFNRIAQEVNGPTVRSNDIITAAIFLQLEQAANNKEIDSNACKMCNVNCDNSCDICEKCDECQDCEQCEGCVNCMMCEGCSGDCEYCNVTCESGNSTEE